MPFDRDYEACVHLENLLQGGGITLQNRLIFRPDITLVVLEMDVLNLVRQKFPARFGSVRYWQRAPEVEGVGDGHDSICLSGTA